MKHTKSYRISQRRILDRRLAGWNSIPDPESPPSGWIRAIRGALGMTTRQLARLLGTTHSGVIALEKREAAGTISIEMIKKAAHAMNCKLVYAIVPESEGRSIEALLDSRARAVASSLLARVEHSMRLEKQGSSKKETDEHIQKLAVELKSNLDSRLWDAPAKKGVNK